MRCRPSIVAAVLATLPVVGCVLQDWSSYAGGAIDAGAGEAGATTGEAGPGIAAEAGATVDAYGLEVAADGPVAWYRFDDPDTATQAADAMGAYPAALPAGALLRVPGAVGRGVHLDGTGGLDVGDVLDFAGQVPFTLETWVKTTATPEGRDQLLFDKRDDAASGGPLGYIGYLGGNLTPQFQGWGVDFSSWAEAPISTERFAHVVFVVSYATGKGNASLYVDGAIAPHGGFDNTKDLADTPKHLLLGSTLVGTLDEIAIYAKALPAARILAHTRAGLGH